MFEKKYTVNIFNESNEKTTITLGKLKSDTLLQLNIDLHEEVQKTYNRVSKNRPNLSRRIKGDFVRLIIHRRAQNESLYSDKISKLL